jgi:hypothetical protein
MRSASRVACVAIAVLLGVIGDTGKANSRELPKFKAEPIYGTGGVIVGHRCKEKCAAGETCCMVVPT